MPLRSSHRLERPPAAASDAGRNDPQSARAAAVALLARRDLARAQLMDRLVAKGFDDVLAGAVVAELGAEGAVNDERYAQNYVAYHVERGQGPVRIAADLRRAGVSEVLAAAALAGAGDWHALARQARCARFGAAVPESWPDKARQARFLQYRGFSADHIRAATGADPELD
jgi:regulatory protein